MHVPARPPGCRSGALPIWCRRGSSRLFCHTWLAQTYRKQITFDQDFAVRMLVRPAHHWNIGNPSATLHLQRYGWPGIPIGVRQELDAGLP
jgi:hypothetical protein